MSGVNKHSALTDSTLHVAKGHADGITSMIPYKSGSSTQAFALIETISAGTFRPCLDIADSTVAPPTEVDGDIYLLDSSGTPHADWDSSSQEDWVYYDGTNDTWISVTPVEGTYCHDQDTGNLYCFDGTNWAAYTASASAGGSTTQVQFNDAGGLAGMSGTSWTSGTSVLELIHLALANGGAGTGELRFKEGGGGANYVGFKAPGAFSGDQIWVLPNADGNAGEVLKTDGAGALAWVQKTQSIAIACSDESTALTTGTAKATFRMPYAFTLTEVRASLTTAPTTSGLFTVDINEAGTTVLSTKLTIDNTETTSTTAATPAVISDTALADDAEITVDIDAISGGATEAGLKVYLIGYKA
jgi:hypothetical protein